MVLLFQFNSKDIVICYAVHWYSIVIKRESLLV